MTNEDRTPAPHTEYATGLRAFADMIEQNPEILEVLQYLHLSTHIFAEDDPQSKLALFARIAARYTTKVEKSFSTSFASVVAQFAGVRVSVQTDRDEVCERVVTGTETVTKTVPDPDALAAVPTVEVTEEVEQVEWRCRPLLAGEVS
jgi:hypothetical protein